MVNGAGESTRGVEDVDVPGEGEVAIGGTGEVSGIDIGAEACVREVVRWGGIICDTEGDTAREELRWWLPGPSGEGLEAPESKPNREGKRDCEVPGKDIEPVDADDGREASPESK